MLTLMSPPLGLGKRCPSKVAYKVDQPFLLRGLELSQEPGLEGAVGGGAGGSRGGVGGIQHVFSSLVGSLVCSEESWPHWLVSTAHACDAAVVTRKPGELWGGRPQWKRRGRISNSVEVGGLEKMR